MRTYWFWVRRTHETAFELLAVMAASAYDAILGLPRCVSWNFSVREEVSCP